MLKDYKFSDYYSFLHCKPNLLKAADFFSFYATGTTQVLKRGQLRLLSR